MSGDLVVSSPIVDEMFCFESLQDSARAPNWWEAKCFECDMYQTGSEASVEEWAYAHAEMHRPGLEKEIAATDLELDGEERARLLASLPSMADIFDDARRYYALRLAMVEMSCESWVDSAHGTEIRRIVHDIDSQRRDDDAVH